MPINPATFAARLVRGAVLAALLLAVPPALGGGPPAAAPGSSSQDFASLLAQLKAELRELRDLRTRYGNAGASERPEIAKEYQLRVAADEPLMSRLTPAAERAYLANPQPGGELANFLAAAASDYHHRDDFDTCARLCKLLSEHGERSMFELTGIASFDSNDFDAAEKYFHAAEQLGPLSTGGAQIQSELKYYQRAWAEETRLRAAEAKADDLPRVRLHTERGDIVLELFENEAPNTVANFVYLVEQGFYDGLPFYRVVQGRMALTGSPRGNGSDGPGYAIASEARNKSHRIHFRGSVSMFHQPESHRDGSQFFLAFAPAQQLDGHYAVFGRIIEGLDVLSKLRRHDALLVDSPQSDKILKATVLRKRNHKYEPKKLPPG